jgi:hypothetical protein
MFEGKKFQFIVEKIENNTLQLSRVQNPEINFGNLIEYEQQITKTVSNDSLSSNLSYYDSSGAAKYIVVVVLVYGFAIIFFIGSQIRSTKKFSDDQQENNAEKIMRQMETEIFTKEVLGIVFVFQNLSEDVVYCIRYIKYVSGWFIRRLLVSILELNKLNLNLMQ